MSYGVICVTCDLFFVESDVNSECGYCTYFGVDYALENKHKAPSKAQRNEAIERKEKQLQFLEDSEQKNIEEEVRELQIFIDEVMEEMEKEEIDYGIEGTEVVSKHE